MRTLLYIPIIHARADMGSLADSVRRITVEKLGWRRWKNNVEAVEQLWRLIWREIEGLDLPYPHVRLYQDGLAVCGREIAIVSELAEAGSSNHRLLLHLIEKGAVLMGTESPDLLLQEYSLMQRLLEARGTRAAGRIEQQQETVRRSLLERRDRFIATHINETLREGETGILFLGILHLPQRWFANDIDVSYPVVPWIDRGERRPTSSKRRKRG